MSIVLPSAYDVLTPADLTGLVGIDGDTLDRIAKNANWLYAHHTPALLACRPMGSGTSLTWYAAAVPSADGLDYRVDVYAHGAIGDTLSLTIDQATASGAYVAGTTYTRTLAATAERWTVTSTLALATTTRRLRIRLMTDGASCSLGWLGIYPATMSSIPSSAQPSGWTPHDSAALSASGAAVHTEYADRIAQGVSAILRDRRQCVASYVDGKTYAYAARTGVTRPRVMFGRSHLPGQTGVTVTVRVYASDSGATNGTLRVGQSDGAMVSFTADGTEQSATLSVSGDAPVFWADVEPVGTATVHYILIDWAPCE